MLSNNFNSDTQSWREKAFNAWNAKTHAQRPNLTPFDFVQMANARSIDIKINHLETWDRLGVFHPLVRVQNASESIPFSMEIPTQANYRPWREYDNFDNGEWTRTGGVYYHPHQLFRLQQVSKCSLPTVRFNDFSVPIDIGSMLQRQIDLSMNRLRHTEIDHLKQLYLLFSIEDLYFPAMSGDKHMLRVNNANTEASNWFQYRSDSDPKKLLEELGLNVKEIKEIRDGLAHEGWNIDPNRDWFMLNHHVSYARRQTLRGEALRAWDFYEAAEIINDFLKDCMGEVQPHLDDLMQGGGSWKRAIYGIKPEEINYREPNVLHKVLAEFTIDPRLRVLLVIEGETEQKYIQTYCEDKKLDLENFGVRLFNIRTVDGLKSNQVKEAVRAACKDEAAIVVVVDDEHNSREELGVWLKDGLILRVFPIEELSGPNHPVGGSVWTPCFEDANFNLDELIRGWIDYIETHPKDFNSNIDLIKAKVQAVKAAATPEDPCDSWIKAMELSVKDLRLPFNKPGIAICLAKRYGNTKRPIHQLIDHAYLCAIMIRNFGPADADGGYGHIYDLSDDETNPSTEGTK